MGQRHSVRTSRRSLLKHVAGGAGVGLGAILAGCRRNRDTVRDAAGSSNPGRRLRAAFSNDGLQSSWCKLGYETAMLWGEVFDVEVVWFDGQLDPRVQLDQIEAAADQDWDFCAFQSHQIGLLEEPIKRLKKRNIPVVSMDTLLVERHRLRNVGAWIQIAGDHVAMAESSARYVMEKIGGKGKVIHIGGASTHSGSQQRDEGFRNVLKMYPEVGVLGGEVRWCDWDPKKARETFQSLLEMSEEPISGAFFHSDEMALACVPALEGTRHEGMVITGIDGQKEGLDGIQEGRIDATAVNPVCMIHMYALVIGQHIVRNEETLDEVPLEIICPSPLVAKEIGNLEAMYYLSDSSHCLF